MRKKAIVLLADGFEEIEAITVIDILRRAGVDTLAAGVSSLQVKGARGIIITADKKLEEVGKDFDACILPGGMPGATNLAASQKVKSLLQELNKQGKVIAAICAAPSVVLAPLGILKGRATTGYPGMTENFEKTTIYKKDKVVIDQNLITSQGPATALLFALAIAEKLVGKDISEKVRKATLAG